MKFMNTFKRKEKNAYACIVHCRASSVVLYIAMYHTN